MPSAEHSSRAACEWRYTPLHSSEETCDTPEPNFKYRILVVDDDPMVRETSALVLIKEGYDVRTSEDGFSALIKLRTASPDLVIADLRMPNMSGFELLSIVRRRFPQIPVVAISGEFNAEGPVGLLADAFFQKGAYRPAAIVLENSGITQKVSSPAFYCESRVCSGLDTGQ